jgi:hypothetical protein
MTTIAYHQYTNIPSMSGSYAFAPVSGPLQHKHPCIVQMVDNGIQTGIHINPPKYGVADNSGDVSIGRSVYSRTNTTRFNMQTGTRDFALNKPTTQYIAGLQKSFLVSQSKKYIGPKDSSQFTSAKKSASIGQSGISKTSSLLSYKSYDNNLVRTQLMRCRSGGCVAPAKKGSIFNTYRTNTHWGAEPRSTYS